jgi:hypothetical protein
VSGGSWEWGAGLGAGRAGELGCQSWGVRAGTTFSF